MVLYWDIKWKEVKSVSKQLEYTIKAKFLVATDRIPDKNIEDIKAEIEELGGKDFKIAGQKLVDVE